MQDVRLPHSHSEQSASAKTLEDAGEAPHWQELLWLAVADEESFARELAEEHEEQTSGLLHTGDAWHEQRA